MLITFLIYFITIISSSISFYLVLRVRRKIEKCFFLFFAIGIPVFIAGVRYSTGTDYFSYINGFEMVKLGYSVRWEGLEYGYYLLNTLLAHLGFKAQTIMFVASLIMISFIFNGLFNKKYIGLAVFGFLAFMLLFYQSSFNVIRLMLAVSIFFYNISNILNKKLFRFILFSILAISFHISAVITIPLYWVYNFIKVEKSKLRLILTYIGTFLIVISLGYILEWAISIINIESVGYYNSYASGEGGSLKVVFLTFLLYMPLIIPGIFFYGKCKEINKDFPFYYSLVINGVIIKSLAIFQAKYVNRIGEYFLISLLIIIPIYMKVFVKTKNYLFYFGVIGYLFFYWFYLYFVLQHHGTVPYQWIFNF